MNEEQLLERINKLETQMNLLIFSDRYLFQRNIQMQDGRNIQLARGTGTKIGTETTQKIGFFGTTPVIQQTVGATTAAAIITSLRAYGLLAP